MKGQSSAEQLITYGWAAMIMVTVIGVMLYFGVFNMFNNVPERCVFQSGFVCKTSRLYAGPDNNITVRFEVSNKLSNKVRITDMLCSAEPANPSVGYPNRGFVPMDVMIDPGFSATFTATCFRNDGNTEAVKGQPYMGVIYVRYENVRSAFAQVPGANPKHMKMASIGGSVN